VPAQPPGSGSRAARIQTSCAVVSAPTFVRAIAGRRFAAERDRPRRLGGRHPRLGRRCHHPTVRCRPAAAALAAALALGCGADRGPAPVASRLVGGASCTAAVAPAPEIAGVPMGMLPLAGHPFGVGASGDGRWLFAALDASVAVLAVDGGAPRVVGQVSVPGHPSGLAVTHDGAMVLVASDRGAVVVDARRAEAGDPGAVLGALESPAGDGAVEVAVSADDRFAFVTLEKTGGLAVFDLARARAGALGTAAFVAGVPLGQAPAGVALSPDGRWLYATSESPAPGGAGGSQGTLSVVDLRVAESGAAGAVVATVAAGCSPVRAAVAADGATVWVTARGGNALLAFSAAALTGDPVRALLATVPVGSEPVGLVIAPGGRVVVADSNRSADGQIGDLTVVDAAAALAGRPALLGRLGAGSFPRDLAVVPADGVLAVGNYASSQLGTVGLAGLP